MIEEDPREWSYDLCCNQENSGNLVQSSGFCTPRDCSFVGPEADFWIQSPETTCEDPDILKKYTISNQCCYKETGELIRMKSEGAGSLSLGSPKIANIFELYKSNMHSFNQCCIAEDKCEIYQKHRPTIIGNFSSSLTLSGQFDPNFATADGLRYPFAGLGVYTLMQTDSENPTTIQISTRKLGSGTVISGIAFSYQSATVEVYRISSTELIFAINGEQFNVSMTSFTKEGVSVVVEENGISMTVLDSQMVIRIYLVPGKDFVAVYTTLNSDFRGHVTGLLGYYDGQAANDLTASGHKSIVNSCLIKTSIMILYGIGFFLFFQTLRKKFSLFQKI